MCLLVCCSRFLLVLPSPVLPPLYRLLLFLQLTRICMLAVFVTYTSLVAALVLVLPFPVPFQNLIPCQSADPARRVLCS